MAGLEIERGLALPVNQYAVMENALRAAEEVPVADHRRQLAELWSGFSAVAAGNPHALDATFHPAGEIEAAPTVAFPYSKRHASQWNVDQAESVPGPPRSFASRAGSPWSPPSAACSPSRADYSGPAVVDGYTVTAEGAVAITSGRGVRTVATSQDPALTGSMTADEWCGQRIGVGDGAMEAP